MRTSQDIYHQVRWDARFDPSRFVLGVDQRGMPPKRIPLPGFTPGGDIPWHRVLFVEADGELVWDRATGLDRVDSSGFGLARDPRRLRAPFFLARTPHVWSPAGGWRPHERGGAPGTALPAVGLRLLTWNTLWDRYDSDRIDTARRRLLLLAALEEADADVIALQEVESELLVMLMHAPWVRAGYTLGLDPAGKDVDESGLLLISRLPVKEAGWHALGPHKAVSAIVVETAVGPLVVANTHLSSDHSDRGAARREIELAAIAEGLAAVDCDVALLGDFNDGAVGRDGPDGKLGLRDAWTLVHGLDDQTVTFDPIVNPLAAVSSLSGRASRLDRVLLRSEGLGVAGARLRGDAPTADGLYISDHFGVEVNLEAGDFEAGVAGPSVLDVRPTARTALAWIPPRDLWPSIQEIRQAHDPQIDRWPPHVNVLFGFVPESEFEQAGPLLAAVAAKMAPFAARLEGVRAFEHSCDATVWIDPAAADAAPWIDLHSILVQKFPGCRGRAEGFTPHLTLGRTRDAKRVVAEFGARLAPMSAQVGELVLLSRRGEEPMRPRATIALGTGELSWLPDADDELTASSLLVPNPHWDELAEQVARRVSEALPEGVVHIAGSRRMGCALAEADMDLVAVLPGVVDINDVRERVTAALPSGSRVRQLIGARVPGLHLRVGELSADVIVAGTGSIAPQEAVTRRVELGEATAITLSAVSDGDAVKVDGNRARLARLVKVWAKARGLDSASFGGMPGLAWVIMTVLTAIGSSEADTDDETLLRDFFGTWAAWDWRQTVALSATTPIPPMPRPAAVTVITPSAPFRNCTEQVGSDFRDLLARELYEAWEIVETAASTGVDPWPELMSPPPLHRRHASWAVVTIRATGTKQFEETLGRVRGRMRALLTALEEAGTADAHAWPRPFDVEPATARFAIGLGRTPPSARELGPILAGWVKGLTGVTVEVVECGAVPSLR